MSAVDDSGARKNAQERRVVCGDAARLRAREGQPRPLPEWRRCIVMGFRSDPNHCPRCRERVSAFAAGCGLCDADLDPRRHARRRPLWLRALTGALVSCIAVALIVAAGLAQIALSQ